MKDKILLNNSHHFFAELLMQQFQPVHKDIISDYKLLSKIGEGTFSEVFKAVNQNDGSYACIKVINKDQIHDEETYNIQQNEINVMSELNHPNIARLYDIHEDSNFLYLIMEFCPGQTLLDIVNIRGELPNTIAYHIFKQLVNALAYMHNCGFCHRDIKLENIIVDQFYHLKLIDFGFSTPIKEGELFCNFCGSLLYAAPELYSYKPYDGTLADVWSAGVVLYAMLVGSLPFDCNDMNIAITQIKCGSVPMNCNICPSCKDLLFRIFKTDPKERITSEEILLHPWMINNLPKKPNKHSKSSALLPNARHSMFAGLQLNGMDIKTNVKTNTAIDILPRKHERARRPSLGNPATRKISRTHHNLNPVSIAQMMKNIPFRTNRKNDNNEITHPFAQTMTSLPTLVETVEVVSQ